MQVNEQLLTVDEIASITLAALDPELSDERIVQIGLTPTRIVRVTKPSKLILIKGNEYTGLHHITLRHGYHSLQRTWQVDISPEGNQSLRLDDPSRFRPSLIPIIDYPKIAEAVFSKGELDVTKNKRPELFDKYVGSFIYPDNIAEQHTLILYKNTKIIHTLFPNKSLNNRPKLRGFHLKREQTKSEWRLGSNTKEVIVPYSSKSGVIKYAITFKSHSDKKLEIGLYYHDKSGERSHYLLIAERSLEGNSTDFFRDGPRYVQYADLRWIEQYIKDTESGLMAL